MTQRALIFANGEINDGPMVRRALAAAADAIIIAADGGAHAARRFDLEINLVIGDMDSLGEAALTTLTASGVEALRHPPEKDETDLELALLWAAQSGIEWIRIIGALGGRLDQTLSNIFLLALPQLNGRDVRLVAGIQEAWLCYPGETIIDGASGDTVSLIPLNGAAHGVRTENLYYPLHDETLTFGPARGVSNVMSTDQARVWLRDGVLLLVHTEGRA